MLDNDNGVVLFPGVSQLATAGNAVDLRAQVSGTTVSSYNWNLSGLGTDAGTPTASTTFEQTWQWINTFTTTHTDSVTLSVTDTNSHTETYTYDFWLPAGHGTTASGGSATWPTSLAPDQELDSAPAFDSSDNASVDATSGALDTQINLPSYNPNIPALALTYDSVTANPLPIVVVENTLSSSAAVPSKVSAQLTFNSSGGTAWYYNTSQFNPGDVQQISSGPSGTASPAGTASSCRSSTTARPTPPQP